MGLNSKTPSRTAPLEGKTRRFPVGAEVQRGGVAFRVWAPSCKRVEVVADKGAAAALTAEDAGYFSGLLADLSTGSRYRFRLDGSEMLYPDPVSRYQPEGPHGPSEVVDPNLFHWTDSEWRGVGCAGQVLYEMHIGTLTPEGTWAAAARELPWLAELGVTCIEVMPVADFAGRFGWGYDGVDLFAPTRLYGTPDDFRRFVDAAHKLGLGVILDIVYNHLGPDGNYLPVFSERYFSNQHMTDWGKAINFDGPDSAPVREFFLSNARYWIEEFHLDGFRFDATQAIIDESPEHILAAVVRTTREAVPNRELYFVAENEPQHSRVVRPPQKAGFGLTSLWNDDFHHSAMVVIAGHNEAYYSDHRGSPQEFISAAKWGYLFQGQRYSWQKKRRGAPALDLPPTAFVHFIQNHDQVANSALGLRANHLASPAQLRAMTALLLLMPQTPMLFQGQEFNASSTFHYFADHKVELAKMVRAGRIKELSQFCSIATQAVQEKLLMPHEPSTFLRSKLDLSEREQGQHAYTMRMYKDLLRIRREEPVFRRVSRRGDIDGSVLGPSAFLLRFFGESGDDRLLLINFGSDLTLDPAPEPLLAPPEGKRWKLHWSSEDLCYGGAGTPAPETELEGWLIMGRSAVLLSPAPEQEARIETRLRNGEDLHVEPGAP